MILHLLTNRNPRDGFGMVGVILTILTISMASVGVFVVSKSMVSNKSNRETTSKAASLLAAVNRYRIHHASTNPDSLDYLITHDGGADCALDNAPASSTYLLLQGWCGPYLDVNFREFRNEFSTDGWGSGFRWDPSGVLTSCGPDLTCGSGDDLAFRQ